MLSNFSKENNIIKKVFDICIIGGGASGITIAKNLDKKFKICLLESLNNSDDTFRDTSEEIYDGKDWEASYQENQQLDTNTNFEPEFNNNTNVDNQSYLDNQDKYGIGEFLYI